MWGEAKNKPTRNLTLGEEVSLPPPPFLFSFFFFLPSLTSSTFLHPFPFLGIPCTAPPSLLRFASNS